VKCPWIRTTQLDEDKLQYISKSVARRRNHSLANIVFIAYNQQHSWCRVGFAGSALLKLCTQMNCSNGGIPHFLVLGQMGCDWADE
jgi:hypothetical protein